MNVPRHSILLFGLNEVHSISAKERILREQYNYINAFEIKLNENLKNEIIGALIINVKDDLDLLYDLPNLRVVSCKSSGMDYLNLEKLHSKNVVVKNCPDEVADETSNIGIFLIISLARKISVAIQANQNPTLYHNRLNGFFGNDIRLKTVGIIGLGSVGLCLAHKASLAFNMKIVYHQRNKRSCCLFPYFENLDDMLPEVDYLVISCPLTITTKHMIHMDRLKLMKPSAYLINIARGGLVKTNDLVEALRCGIIAGAGLDVTDPEPLPSANPLLHMNNVVVLPHIGTFTVETMDAMLERSLENLKMALQTI